MKMEEYIPAHLLKPFVRAYRVIESQDEIVNRVLPDTAFAIAFRLKGQIGYIKGNGHHILPVATLSGLRKSVRLINYKPQTSALIVLFRETGVPAFFKNNLHELFEESVSLDAFISQTEVTRICEQLAEAGSNIQKVTIVEDFLLSKLSIPKPDEMVSAAIARIYSTNGSIRVKELADTLYISQDAFEKRFRKTVGTSPKQFASILRLKSVISNYQNTPSFINLALDNGYFDQAHFNKDFKLFTGQTPSGFFRSASFW